jgi:hemolysin activation/secretion protein
VSALFIGSLSVALPAGAATAPVPPPSVEPGAILQNQLQNRQNNVPAPPPGPMVSPPVLEVTPPAPMELPAAPGVTFQLNGITIDPSSFLTLQELGPLYQSYIGKDVALSDLQKIVDQINALYRAKGVATALAVLPPQRIENGVVHIQLVEGRVGTINIEGASLTSHDYIAQHVGVTTGQVINTDELAQALVRFNRTNQVQLQASLQPGASLGLTDILLRASEPQPFEVQAFADNLGVKSVGRYEGGVFYRANEPLHIGDHLDLYIVGAA